MAHDTMPLHAIGWGYAWHQEAASFNSSSIMTSRTTKVSLFDCPQLDLTQEEQHVYPMLGFGSIRKMDGQDACAQADACKNQQP